MGDLWTRLSTMGNFGKSPSPETCVTVQGGEATWVFGDQLFILALCVIILIVVGAAYYAVRFYRQKYEAKLFGHHRPRFRKRDRFMFYGRKVLRQVKSAASQATIPNKRKKIITKITKKLLKLKTDTPPTRLHVLEPSAEYLQEEIGMNKADQRLPPEVTYMLKSIRMFGIFERPLFLELCKHVETVRVAAGQFLFRIGDADDNFYVVQSGMLNVFITEPDGSPLTLKLVKEGDSIASLLSFTDVLTGHPQPFKTVSAQALEDSSILKLPVDAFREVFETNPEAFVRVIQIVMVRLNRVTFTALHQHLGLSHELVQAPRRKSMAYQGSPTRRNTAAYFASGSTEDNTTPDLLDSDTSTYLHATKSDHNLLGQPIPSGRHGGQTLHSSLKRRNHGVTPPEHSGASSVGEIDSSHQIPTFFVPSSGEYEFDSAAALKQSLNAFKLGLGLEDTSLIKDIVHLKDVPPGAYLAKEESSQIDSGLVYIISGLLTMTQKENEKDVNMFNAHSGEFVGALAVLTGEPSIFTIRAKHHSKIAVMSSACFYSLMSTNPKIVLHLANIVVRRLSPFVRQIDFAMDWIFLEGGRALYRQGDESDCTFIVLSGRLRSVNTRNDEKKQLVGEYGRGDLVGVVETLTRSKRMSTVMAVRDTELAKLPEGLLNAIKLKYPIVMSKLIQLLGHRILGSWQNPSIMSNSSSANKFETKPSHVNFCTVAVLAVTEDVPLTAFTYELIHSLSSIGPSLRLTSEYIKKVLGSSIIDAANEYKLTNWLAQQEDKHRIVLYQCDYTMTGWTQRCIRQADCILIVGMGHNNEPSVGKVEKQLEHLAFRTQKELVLLHKEGSRPKNTAAWLNARSWCSFHFHIQAKNRMFSKKAKMNEYYESIMQQEVNIHSDFSRLARWLTGTSVGLVLGGGGARGAAHIGMLKAIQEAGIPIDMIGGVSIGALMGGLYSMERNIVTVTQKAREWSKKMTQWWRQAYDLTYPITSMFTGAGFNKTLYDVFGDVQIEDLWLPYFNITTDITSSEMRVHTHGPVYLYVRASMTFIPLFPPLPDPEDQHMLVDGVYSDMLGADVMRGQGARYILAVDVGSQDETDFTNYGESLSGWYLLWQRWTAPFRSNPIKVPSLPDIQSRLAYVSCVRQLEETRNSDYCTYIRPPIDRYKTLQFGSFDEIKEVGYQHGTTFFQGLKMGGAMLPLAAFGSQAQYLQKVAMVQKKRSEHQSFSGTYNFTDLAQMVCKVRSNYGVNSDDDDSYEDEDEYGPQTGYASEHSLDFPLHPIPKTSSDPSLSNFAPSSFSEPEGDHEM